MDEEILSQITKAAEDSLKNPGKTAGPLPKDKVGPDDNFIVVFRHGESEDNVNRIFSGWRDQTDITEVGVKQAEALRLGLNKLHIHEVITSDQLRSKHTARIAFATHPNLDNLVWKEDWRIKERNYGDLNGKSKEEAMAMNPEEAIKWRRGYETPPPSGESIKVVEARVWPFLDELVDYIKQHKINAALSASGNSMRAIRRYFEKLTVLEEMTVENPLGMDFALYRI
ncbi:hypothetical protein CO058_03285 [candidate division WWE3 bacterium CG_4_9_14_0_2_um_filter_35_11]|uniref:phosphoglycerate mutase (2,3-diphosphoglycerate-dependent) n=1 Tax=candidate division WWE3 bacterium CG_4_9_14_0_2_um_filter_35_11 TaxID=1975077 RepID=A0A2M8ELD0_UNCKA|nr:MAG: hypothetical protein COV25_03775 [candidate division WWE3 bacterium CG10_big_fil_rev_8_21_14_0_10_35_32]PJC23507.1 MAG: hypothetical protein CO058_03285 [candidate division WWE3 bacterium CG_4_9_14_0_2_um_filter_35_11]